jgi:hypothetical protein
MSRRGRGGRNRNNHRHGGVDRQHGQHHRGERRPDGSPTSSVGPHADSGRVSHGKFSFQSAIQPRRTLSRPPKEPIVSSGDTFKRYQVIFYDSLAQAKSDLENLRTLASQCDQLNIVVRAEASMDDPELTSIGKLFCGAAWALIHERRRDAGWYEQSHE